MGKYLVPPLPYSYDALEPHIDAKTIVVIISGVAIVVVGGFMMGAIARLWAGKEPKNSKDKKRNSDI